jgi:hypothetical protein
LPSENNKSEREVLDFHKWGTAVDTVLVKKKKKKAQRDFAGI